MSYNKWAFLDVLFWNHKKFTCLFVHYIESFCYKWVCMRWKCCHTLHWANNNWYTKTLSYIHSALHCSGEWVHLIAAERTNAVTIGRSFKLSNQGNVSTSRKYQQSKKILAFYIKNSFDRQNHDSYTFFHDSHTYYPLVPRKLICFYYNTGYTIHSIAYLCMQSHSMSICFNQKV